MVALLAWISEICKLKTDVSLRKTGPRIAFCDFNRCNAAGIIDLRNLAATRNEDNENKIAQNEKYYDDLLKKEKTTGSLIQNEEQKETQTTTYINDNNNCVNDFHNCNNCGHAY